MKIILTKIIALMCVLCVCNCIVDNGEINRTYPTIIYSLTDEQLSKLQSEFDLLNNNKIVTRLDQFGLTGYTVVSHSIEENAVMDSSIIFQIVSTCLRKNSKYTNVTNESTLTSYRMIHHSNIGWKMFFSEQIYRGLKVLETNIEVYVDLDGVYRIDNHFYRDIYIPNEELYSEEQAKALLIGKQINYWPGRTYIVTDSSFSEIPSKKVIVPIQTDTQIEFRVTWEIKTGLYWSIYIDIIKGEEIKIIQNVIFG